MKKTRLLTSIGLGVVCFLLMFTYHSLIRLPWSCINHFAFIANVPLPTFPQSRDCFETYAIYKHIILPLLSAVGITIISYKVSSVILKVLQSNK